MKRREFVSLLGGVAALWPIAAPAQQAPRPVIGLLGSGTAAAQSEWTAALLQRLRELGWSEGRNLTIEYRWGEGRTERFSEIAAEFVQRKVTIILTHTPHHPLQQSRRHRRSPLCSQRPAIRSAPGSSQAWRDRAVTSRGCQARHPMLLVKSSNSSVRSSLVCIDWPLWPMSIIHTLPSICAKSRNQPAHSELRSPLSKSDEAKSWNLLLMR